MKRIFCVFSLVLMLGGCALMGPTSQNPQLTQASKAAQEAIQTAREVGATDTHSEDLSMVQSRYNELRNQLQNSPSMALVEEFQAVERGAYQTAINSLQQQLQQKDKQFSSIKTKVEKLQSKLDNRVNALEARVQSLEKQNRSLEQENKSLTSKNEKLTQQKKQLKNEVSQLKTQINDLQGQITRLNKQKKALVQELARVRDARDRIQAKLETQGETIDQLRSKLKNRTRTLQSLEKQNKKIKSELDKTVQEADVRTKDRKVYISLQSKLLFGLGNVHVEEDIRDELKTIAGVLKKYPDRNILVEGHTDDLPLENELKDKYGSNWELSAHRALNVLKYLVYAQGIDPKRIGAVAYGKFRPRVPNTSTANRQKNRRVEIVLLPPDLPVKTRDLTGDSQ